MAGGFAKYSDSVIASGASSGAISPEKTYTVGGGHGFVAGDLVSIADGGVITKAIATSSGALAEGMVISAAATTIVVGFDGVHTITGHGKTVDQWFYLSDSVAGGSGTAPATGWQQRVFYTLDANTVLIKAEVGIYI